MQEHPDETLRRHKAGETTVLKDKLSVVPEHSHHHIHGRRVRSRVWEQQGKGKLVPVFKKATVYINPDKTSAATLPHILRYDSPGESDEEVDVGYKKPLGIIWRYEIRMIGRVTGL